MKEVVIDTYVLAVSYQNVGRHERSGVYRQRSTYAVLRRDARRQPR